MLNKALCIALLLRSKRSGRSSTQAAAALGVVTVPRALPRLVPLPSAEGRVDFIMLHKLIESQVERMFRGYEVLGARAVPGHAQQQSLPAGGGIAQRAGERARGVAQPAQG